VATTRPISPPSDRTSRNRLVLVGLAIILVFAVIGVVTAGIFVGSAISSSPKSSPKAVPTGAASSSTLRDIHRAQAQATSIVAQARKSGHAAAQDLTRRARAQATALVVAAKRRAGVVAAQVPTAAAAPPAVSAAPQPTYAAPSTSSGGAVAGSTAAGAPDLNEVPAAWKVVAYGATFGSGPGVGSVTVLNRSSGSFSGTVKIAYAKGGAAYASFSGLAPGQSAVLTLTGTPYSGGGYTILLPTVR
jgi:hypothetical protein